MDRAISMEKKDLLGVRTKPVTALAGVGGGGRRLAKAVADYLMYAPLVFDPQKQQPPPTTPPPTASPAAASLVSCRFLVSSEEKLFLSFLHKKSLNFCKHMLIYHLISINLSHVRCLTHNITVNHLFCKYL
jgi:hypothetical protein